MLVLLLFGISLALVFVEGLNMSYILPAAKCDLGITTSQQGLLNSVNYIGVILTSHFWGFTADSWGRKNVLRLCYFLVFFFSVLSSLSVSITMLFITRLLVGMR